MASKTAVHAINEYLRVVAARALLSDVGDDARPDILGESELIRRQEVVRQFTAESAPRAEPVRELIRKAELTFTPEARHATVTVMACALALPHVQASLEGAGVGRKLSTAVWERVQADQDAAFDLLARSTSPSLLEEIHTASVAAFRASRATLDFRPPSQDDLSSR